MHPLLIVMKIKDTSRNTLYLLHGIDDRNNTFCKIAYPADMEIISTQFMRRLNIFYTLEIKVWDRIICTCTFDFDNRTAPPPSLFLLGKHCSDIDSLFNQFRVIDQEIKKARKQTIKPRHGIK